MRKDYAAPRISSEKCFETNALACAKTTDPPAGSWHFSSAYDTFTGHFGLGLGDAESQSGSTGIGFGSGGTSQSYYYAYGIAGLCQIWVTYAS